MTAAMPSKFAGKPAGSTDPAPACATKPVRASKADVRAKRAMFKRFIAKVQARPPGDLRLAQYFDALTCSQECS